MAWLLQVFEGHSPAHAGVHLLQHTARRPSSGMLRVLTAHVRGCAAPAAPARPQVMLLLGGLEDHARRGGSCRTRLPLT